MAEMADDVDEEVVFEHSALYNHLQNVGYQNEDIDAEDRYPLRHMRHASAIRENYSMAKAFLQHFHASWLTWLGIGDEWHQQQNELDTQWGGEVCQIALEEDALEPEDAEFLQHVSNLQKQEDREEQDDGAIRTTLSRTSRYGLERLLSVGLGVTAYTTIRLFYPRVTAMTLTYDWIVGLFGLMLILPPTIRIVHTWKYNRQHTRIKKAFSEMLTSAAKWRKLTRRSIRLVQEMELVARGFILVSHVSPAERLEAGGLLHARRQCPELRRLILLSCRDLMIHMRNATNDLIQAWPLGGELETMYLCQVSLEEYGSIITTTDEQILSSSTDNFGLTHIKAVLEICDLQLSEYVKRAVLMCLVPAPHTVSAKHSVDVFGTSLPTVTSHLTQATDSLLASYKVHRCGLLTECSGDSVSGELRSKRRNVLNNTYTAVHSLDLHLQTALKRARTMGDELEELCTKKTTLEDGLKKQLHTELEKVKAELDACVDCWDEAFLQISMSRKQAQSTVASPGTVTQAPVQAQTAQVPIPLFDMDDPVVLDQVFEAYTDDNEVDTSSWGHDDILSPEEKEKQKREKKEALRLLKELKTVIAVRAADWDIREDLARQRQNGTEKSSKHSELDDKEDVLEVGEAVKEGFREADKVGGDSLGTKVAVGHGASSGDGDCIQAGRNDDLMEDLVEDLHSDLVNLATQSPKTAIFEAVTDGTQILAGSSDNASEEGSFDGDLSGERDSELPVHVRLAALKEKLSREPGAGFGFSASAVASMAAQRSQNFGQGDAQTFGNSDSSDEGVIES